MRFSCKRNCFSSFKCVLYDFRMWFRVCGVKVAFLWGFEGNGNSFIWFFVGG